MGSKTNSQQAPEYCPREITNAKLSQAKSSFIHILLLNNEKRGKREIWANLGRFGQVGTSLGKFGQGNKLKKWEKGRKNKKIEQKFEWLWRRRSRRRRK